MKNKARIVAGIALLIFALVCPFPSQFGISWAVWRAIMGALGCASLALGIYQTVKQ
ncbi:MAG: hypothetical protein IKN96_05365 [Oscillibacter sp.]|nr:hypothetical protein [Oscillibacter sp.]